MQNSLNLEYVKFYIEKGFQPIPVYEKSKIPIGNRWNTKWNEEKSIYFFENNPKCNIGILLGNIIDVEADTEEANQLLCDLICDFKHPCYRSSKSFHHFFINPDPNLTAIKYQGIEFRGYKHHSVVPPSFHKDGTEYKWLKESIFPPPEMPERLLEFYKDIIKKRTVKRFHRKKLKPGHIKTHCNCCKKTIYLHKKRLILEVKAFLSLGSKWMCQGCREIDLRPISRKIKKNLQKLT